MLLPPDPNNYPTTIQGDLQYQVDLKNYELKSKNAINEIHFNNMRNELYVLRGVANEYNDLIVHCNAGGSFDEFMKSKKFKD